MAATSAAIGKLSELASGLRKSVSGFTLPDQSGGTGVLSQVHVAATLERAEQARPPNGEVAQVAERRRSSG
jgi:hypothetical protein